MIVTVQNFYMTHYAEPKAKRLGWTDGRLQTNFKYPFRLLMEFLGDQSAKVSILDGPDIQAFMQHCVNEHGHAVSTISRNLSIIKAAMNFAAKTRTITDADGVRRKVKILKYAPEIPDTKDAIAETTGATTEARRAFVPTVRQMAKFIDTIESEHLFRYCVIALHTWARPQAITDLDTSQQVDYDAGLLYLNPPGRAQTKKYRPAIRLTQGLRAWIEQWPAIPVQFNNAAVASVKGAFQRHRKRKGVRLPEMSRYSIRHFMARRVAACKDPRVPREQRKAWLGHHRQDTTAWYEEFEPDWLDDCAEATEKVIAEIDRYMKNRSLYAPTAPRIRLVKGGKG